MQYNVKTKTARNEIKIYTGHHLAVDRQSWNSEHLET